MSKAHMVQNSDSQLAQACYALRSTRRWAITGTPIQNKLTDLASIIRFLRVYPYSDKRIFIDNISRPFQNCRTSDAQGFLRIKTLVRAITLSRTKAVIDLPHRADETHHLDSTPAERVKYETEKIRVNGSLEEVIPTENPVGRTFNALTLLNRLRSICNHGIIETNSVRRIYQNSGNTECCSICGAYLLGDIFGVLPTAYSEDRNRMICERCRSQENDGETMSPGSNRDFLSIPESSIPTTPVTPGTDDDGDASNIECMSTKINALVSDLDKRNNNGERS